MCFLKSCFMWIFVNLTFICISLLLNRIRVDLNIIHNTIHRGWNIKKNPIKKLKKKHLSGVHAHFVFFDISWIFWFLYALCMIERQLRKVSKVLLFCFDPRNIAIIKVICLYFQKYPQCKYTNKFYLNLSGNSCWSFT